MRVLLEREYKKVFTRRRMTTRASMKDNPEDSVKGGLEDGMGVMAPCDSFGGIIANDVAMVVFTKSNILEASSRP